MFYQLDHKNCFIKQRCDGIYQIMKEFGQDPHYAQEFARYTWRRSLLNKLADKRTDPARTFGALLNKALSNLLYPLFKVWNHDVFWIDTQIQIYEDQIREMEKEQNPKDPMVYFETVGKGYGVFFKYAAFYAKTPKVMISTFHQLGFHLGTLIALRDSYMDLARDRLNGAYNPFLSWEPSKIRAYYISHKKRLTQEITALREILDIQARIQPIATELPSSSALDSIQQYLTKINTCSHACQRSVAKVNHAVHKIPPWARILSSVLCLLPHFTSFGVAATPTLAINQASSDCCCCYWLEALNCECTCCDNACQNCCDNACEGCDCNTCECSGCNCNGCDCNCNS